MRHFKSVSLFAAALLFFLSGCTPSAAILPPKHTSSPQVKMALSRVSASKIRPSFTAPHFKEVLPLAAHYPILEYHCVDQSVRIKHIPQLYVSPGQFDQQMGYLSRHHYTPLTFDQYANAKKYKKPVFITLDDGYEDNYTYAYPILKKYHFRATIFLIAGKINHPFYLTKNQILDMQNTFSFQSHTVTHPHLTRLTPDEVDYELSTSKSMLELLLGKPIIALSYPYGDYNRSVMADAKKYYRYGIAIPGGLSTGNYDLKRIEILSSTSLKNYQRKLP